ncbi:MAG TPA: aminotransferase class I/II-fold pyridoxal phosphate-dependent enzyme [Verrucomicrobiae bacterium]|nr:aminotransferase class I/II-fold pyridoxal phosphate-dependent enzyme [Verrucomicrobiae bacterium]
MTKTFAEPAARVAGLGSAIFSEMDDLRQVLEAQGTKIVNLGIGSPDQPPAPHVKQALLDAVAADTNYGYTLTQGIRELKDAIAGWYLSRFEVQLDPATEVLSLMGSQDGLAHIYAAFINPGDLALVPDPGYPIYTAGLLLAGGEKYPMELRTENGFLPDFSEIPRDVAERAKIMFLNYPNNPVAATADLDFFAKVVDFAKEHKIIVCHDNAYSELAYDGYRPPSFLQVRGAKEVGVEFHSISKTYNLAGCRLGFVVGNAKVIEALAMVKSNIDYGVFRAVQIAAVAALEGPQDVVWANAARYQQRRDVLLDGLAQAGWSIPKPKGSMFVWAPLPAGYTSSHDFAVSLLKNAGVLVIPGVAFGSRGEGYVRIALVHDTEVLGEAVQRISDFLSAR